MNELFLMMMFCSECQTNYIGVFGGRQIYTFRKALNAMNRTAEDRVSMSNTTTVDFDVLNYNRRNERGESYDYEVDQLASDSYDRYCGHGMPAVRTEFKPFVVRVRTAVKMPNAIALRGAKLFFTQHLCTRVNH